MFEHEHYAHSILECRWTIVWKHSVCRPTYMYMYISGAS